MSNNFGPRMDAGVVGVATAADRNTTTDSTLKQVHVQVNFLGHCIFCFRKTQLQGAVYFTSTKESPDINELLHVVPTAEVSPSSSPSLLNTFNRIWLPLQKKIEKEEDEDPFGFLGASKANKTVFAGLPRLCRFCAEKLEAVDKLLGELLAEMNGLRKVIQDSKYGGKYSWRASEFEAALGSSSMEQESIRVTLQFLSNLGKDPGIPKESSENQRAKVATPVAPKAISPDPNRLRLIAPRLPSILRRSRPRREVEPIATTLGSHLVPTKVIGNLEDAVVELPRTQDKNFTDEDNSMDHNSFDDIKPENDTDPLSCLDADWHEDEREIPCDSIVSNEASDNAADPLQLPGSSQTTHTNDEEETEFWEDPNRDDDPDYIKSEDESDYSSSDYEDEVPDSEEPTDDDEDLGEMTTPQKAQSSRKHKNATTGSTESPEKPVIMNIDDRHKSKLNVTHTKETDAATGKLKYTCTIGGCGKVYMTVKKSTPTGLKDHQTLIHKIHGDPTVSCELCDKTFSGRKALRKHAWKIHRKKATVSSQNTGSISINEPKSSACDLCKKNVPLGKLLEHVRAHVGDEYVIKCPHPTCKFACSHPTSLAKHLAPWSNPCNKSIPDVHKFRTPTHTCEVCGFRNGHALKFRAHLHSEHETSEKNYPCPIDTCEMMFTVKQSVTFHLPHHDLAANYSYQTCPHCSSQFNIEDLPKHLKEKHQIEEIIKCQHCALIFCSRELLVDHLFTHRYGVLTCDICNDGVRFSRHLKLREHYFQVHKVGKPLHCKYCDTISWTLKNLQSHELKKHFGEKEKEKSIVCEECGIKYKTEHSLREHKIREHGGRPFSCKFCSETFTLKWKLMKHEKDHRGVQEEQKIFKCEVEGCGKVYSLKGQLKQHHLQSHLKKRDHVCETCGKGYQTKTRLKDHVDFVHLGRRPYVCEICGEAFGTSKVLQVHKRLHTGERPFACEICGQRFRQNDVLTRHLEGHRKKGDNFKPNGPMKQIRKRVEKK